MITCLLCNEELDSRYLNSVMDKLSHYKDSPFYSLAEKCPSCQKELLFKKVVLSYYLMNGDKKILIGNA